MSTNTTDSLKEIDESTNKKIEASLEEAKQKAVKEKQVTVSIPKNLESKIGKTLFLAVNGVHVVLPVDGSKHKVPESFAENLQEYLNNLTI